MIASITVERVPPSVFREVASLFRMGADTLVVPIVRLLGTLDPRLLKPVVYVRCFNVLVLDYISWHKGKEKYESENLLFSLLR